MEILHILAPVAVGALIGYCTNYIAIKMLFRPRREVYIGRLWLPFTPGIIPRNKPRMARAVGRAVSEQLLTGEDLLRRLQESSLKQKVCDTVAEKLFTKENSLDLILEKACTQNGPEQIKQKVSLVISEKILHGIERMDIAGLLVKIIRDSFSDLLSRPLVAMFVTQDTIASMSAKLGARISEFIELHGMEVVLPRVSEEVDSVAARSLEENMQSVHIEEERVRELTARAVDHLIETKAPELLRDLDIRSVIEAKINAMEAERLEELLMSVMKQELQAVINLGALIGAVIGIVNIFL